MRQMERLLIGYINSAGLSLKRLYRVIGTLLRKGVRYAGGHFLEFSIQCITKNNLVKYKFSHY